MGVGLTPKQSLDISVQITSGCLPPTICSIDDFVKQVPILTSEEILAFNKPPYGELTPICSLPIRIMGITKDNKFAFYGVNYVGAANWQYLDDYIRAAKAKGNAREKWWATYTEYDLKKILKKVTNQTKPKRVM